jgi:hypothetical protein
MNKAFSTILYKYMPLASKSQNQEKERDRIKEILVDHKVFFAKPSKLNDIFECKPQFIIPKSYEKRKMMAREAIDRHRPGLHGSERKAEIANLIDRMKDPEKMKENFWKWADGYGLLCLTDDPHNPIMWSHYATKYTGICIGFEYGLSENQDADPEFGVCRGVTYQKGYPCVTYPNETPYNMVISTVFTKYEGWAYENEYRFAKGPFEGGYGHVSFNSDRIKEIILGPLMNEREQKFIVDTSKSGLLKNVTIFKGQISKTKYAINKGRKIYQYSI